MNKIVDKILNMYSDLMGRLISRLTSNQQMFLLFAMLIVASFPIASIFSWLSHLVFLLRWMYAFSISLVGFLVLIPFVDVFMREGKARTALRKPDREAIQSLKWHSFEVFCQLLFAGLGYEVEVRGGFNADGGIDFIAIKDKKKYAVQCKKYLSEEIGIGKVRELIGVSHLEHMDGCIFITSGFFDQYVEEKYGSHDFIKLWDIDVLADRAADVKTEQTDVIFPMGEVSIAIRLLCREADMATDFLQPRKCKKCRRIMRLVVPKNESPYWGCSDYPNCKSKQDLADFEKKHIYVLG